MPCADYAGHDLEAMDCAERYHRWILSEFLPFVRGDVAEVGAGSGAFSEMLLELSEVRRLVAVEPSERMCSLLAQRLGCERRAEVHRAFFRDVAAPEELDTLLYVNVMEHIEDDAGELEAAYAGLRPGGHLCIFVPALRWLYGTVDGMVGHWRRYHRPELMDRVQKAGFSVLRCRYFDAAGVIPWFVVFCVLGRSLRGGQVQMYDRLVVPLAQRLEGLFPPPLGKNLLLVARKPDRQSC